MKKFLQEFKEFAMRGNVLDLAVGVIIGGAFQTVVKSLTDNIISPLIGLFAKTDFNDLMFEVLGVNIRYGAFITSAINFVIMAFVIFLIVKGMNKLAAIARPKDEQEASFKKCPFCCTEIAAEATRCPNCTSALEEES